MDQAKALAALIFPDVTDDVAAVRKRYPARRLPKDAMVTRIAPSPTGELHIGTFYAAFLSYRMARQSNGTFYLRLDDTDKKREVPGSRDRIPSQLQYAGIAYAEGYLGAGEESGEYGPYVQSKRRSIYRAYAKTLVAAGKAYPCFCTEDDLEDMRCRQKAQGVDIGYHGKWAKDRNLPFEEVRSKIEAGYPYVIRLKSQGDFTKTITVDDMFKGPVRFPENIQDVVLLKSDGLPTYHFAHVVDDALMGTTHVLRGDEWLSSLPLHVELFHSLSQTPPTYGHLAPIMKKEGDSKRKYSKRQDEDGHISFYIEQGIPMRALQEYCMYLINSAYEDWRLANPILPLEAYTIDLSNFSVSGPVFDTQKLANIAKNVVAQMSAEEVLAHVSVWANTYDSDFHAALTHDKDYALAVLGIGRGIENPRKDIGRWSEVKQQFGYFWDAWYLPHPIGFENTASLDFLRQYGAIYTPDEAKEVWFAKLKDCAHSFGYAKDKTQYKENPSAYHGTIADATALLRLVLTGRSISPDLFEIMRIMGAERVRKRIQECYAKQW